MTYSEDHIVLAAEYALGTLEADERALVETMMIVDHGFMDMVTAWDRKLIPLHEMIEPVDAPSHLWQSISASADLVARPEPSQNVPVVSSDAPETAMNEIVKVEETAPVEPVPGVLPASGESVVSPLKPLGDVQAEMEALAGVAVPAAAPAAEKVSESAAPSPEVKVPPKPEVETPQPRKRGGAWFGSLMTLVAAALAAVVALQAYRPDLLPEKLRVKPEVKIVEVPKPVTVTVSAPPAAQFVATLQQWTTPPAFILTVDAASKRLSARRVGAAPVPGKSFELWFVSEKLPRPRSLGVIGKSDFTIRSPLADYDMDTIGRGSYVVTLEPEGGSPTGVATGPTVYSGRLFESVPVLPASSR